MAREENGTKTVRIETVRRENGTKMVKEMAREENGTKTVREMVRRENGIKMVRTETVRIVTSIVITAIAEMNLTKIKMLVKAVHRAVHSSVQRNQQWMFQMLH
jgi:hypothetical protein